MDTEQLLDKLTNAISFRFSDDKTAPGVTVARLKGGYYCSIVRYAGAFAKDKEVVCSAKEKSLAATLKTLATTFVSMNTTPRDPVQELDVFVSAKG